MFTKAEPDGLPTGLYDGSWENPWAFAILISVKLGGGARNRPSGRRVKVTGYRIAATEFVGESVDKGLAAEALPVGQLDKPEAAIIDHAACPQRLDSGALQNHLRALGFPPPSAVCGADRQQKRNPSAGRQLARAEEGLLHVMGMLRERDEVRTGFEESARRLQHPLRPDCLDQAAALEHLGISSRPKNGMVPADRSDGLASA